MYFLVLTYFLIADYNILRILPKKELQRSLQVGAHDAEQPHEDSFGGGSWPHGVGGAP